MEIPSKLKEFYLQSQIREAEHKRGASICENVVAFGQCWGKSTCPQRHFFVGRDGQGPLANETTIINTIEYNIVEMITATQFFVKLAKAKSADNKVRIKRMFKIVTKDYIQAQSLQIIIDFSKSYTKLAFKLALLKAENLESVPITDDAELAEVYLYKDTDDTFKRVEVERLSGESDATGKLRLWAIDDARLIVRRAEDVRLYYLPEGVADHQRHAVQVVITGIVPKDKDVEWPAEPFDLVKTFVFGRPADEYNDDVNEPPEVIARSMPLFILGSKIWVKKVQVITS